MTSVSRKSSTPQLGERFLLAALLHDLGHWPFCHPIEDIHLSDIPSHEDFASRFLVDSELTRLFARRLGRGA